MRVVPAGRRGNHHRPAARRLDNLPRALRRARPHLVAAGGVAANQAIRKVLHLRRLRSGTVCRAAAGALHRQWRDDRLGRRGAIRRSASPIYSTPRRALGGRSTKLPRRRNRKAHSAARCLARRPRDEPRAFCRAWRGRSGTALANAAARAGRNVTLWARDAKSAEKISRTRESPQLPGVKLADGIAVTGNLEQAVAQTNAILLVVPSQAVREVSLALNDVMPSGTPVIACAKGIERGTDRFMTEVIAECAQTALPAILSGPSFAADVARGLPTAVTLAAKDLDLAERLTQALGSGTFRPTIDRRARRGDRRRREERAGHRRGNCHRPRSRRQRGRGADHARICRAVPLRPHLQRTA